MMMDIINCYTKAIEEELELMKDKSLSPQSLTYIDSLLCTYEKLGKPLNHKSEEIMLGDDEDEEEENLNHYKHYIAHKMKYMENGDEKCLEKAHEHLKEFLSHLKSAIMEMERLMQDSTKENMDERAMVKDAIKAIYSSM